ncbi:MAG: hypothetical protein JWR32_1455 [Mycobacterium sp.]|nr:hypothetical protein [Mycobacterium sp.]
MTEQRSDIQEHLDAAAADLARADAIVTDADLVPMWVAHLSQAMESLDKADTSLTPSAAATRNWNSSPWLLKEIDRLNMLGQS